MGVLLKLLWVLDSASSAMDRFRVLVLHYDLQLVSKKKEKEKRKKEKKEEGSCFFLQYFVVVAFLS